MLLRLLFTLVAVGLVACSSGQGAPRDASTDAHADAARDARADARRDAGLDARSDTGVDARRDTGVDAHAAVDAGLDADWLGCDPGWTPMPGVDADLSLYYATNPSCLLPIAWESCGPGCQRLVDDPRFQRAIDSGWSDGEQHLFTLVEGNAGLSTLDANIITVIASAEDQVFGAWRGSASGDRTKVVRVGAMGGSNAWAGFNMHADRFDSDGNFASYDERLYHAPLSALTGPLEPVLRLAPPVVSVTDIPQFVVASDTTLAAEVQPRGEVLVVEHDVAHWLGGRGSATPATPQGVMVVGHDVYWMDFFESYPGVRLAHGTWSTESEVFYELPGVDLLDPASDGRDFAWVQGYDYDYLGGTGYSHMELWASPYTNDKSALVPRKVADFEGGGDAVLSDELYVGRHSIEPATFVDVYSLRDGAHLQWQVPDGWFLDGAALWVSATEVAYGGRLTDRGQRTVIRLSLADAFTLVP